MRDGDEGLHIASRPDDMDGDVQAWAQRWLWRFWDNDAAESPRLGTLQGYRKRSLSPPAPCCQRFGAFVELDVDATIGADITGGDMLGVRIADCEVAKSIGLGATEVHAE